MTEPKGHPCPECGTPRRTDNTPVCGCGRRAADALRDTRTAEAAAAEDFDPLRIRPYVAFDAAPGTGGAAPRPPGSRGAATRRRPGTGTAPASPDRAAPGAPGGSPAFPDRTLSGQTPPEPGQALPDPAFRSGVVVVPPEGAHGARPARTAHVRRRLLLLAAAGSVVAVAAATGYASGMFSYDTPTRNAAVPSDLRAGVPDSTADGAGPGTSAPAAGPSASSRPSVRASAAPSPSASASLSASPSHRPGKPSAEATSAAATGSATPASADVRSDGPVLRRGDRGPEVAELQSRLRQLDRYGGDADGRFTRPLENALRGYQWSRGVDTEPDELGVYGPDTRRSLEAETREP